VLLSHYELKIEVNGELGFNSDLGFWKSTVNLGFSMI
jgi:hypothetical protein